MYPSVKEANEALVKAEARSLGHETRVICTWMIEDDADFEARCPCGWVSRSVRSVFSARQLGNEHERSARA